MLSLEPGADMTSVSTSVMDRLRESTAVLHEDSEKHAFQCALASGNLPRTTYVAYLSQLFLMHQSLEQHLRAHWESIPAFQSVIKEHQFQEKYLYKDLVYFEVDAQKVVPTAATRYIMSQIESSAHANPIALLGYHYVLEGSNNGAKLLAKSTRKAFELPENSGTNYLNPYGEKQREWWLAFKQDMNSVNFSEDEILKIIEAAKIMFAGFVSIGSDLLAILRF